MRYYDVSTRRRPVWEEFIEQYKTAILCRCGDILHTRQSIFEHWQQGHFDMYMEE